MKCKRLILIFMLNLSTLLTAKAPYIDRSKWWLFCFGFWRKFWHSFGRLREDWADFLLDCLWDDFDVLRPLTPWIHLKFFYKHFFISIKAQIFSIYLIIYHLFKHFAQAQLKSAMLIKVENSACICQNWNWEEKFR